MHTTASAFVHSKSFNPPASARGLCVSVQLTVQCPTLSPKHFPYQPHARRICTSSTVVLQRSYGSNICNHHHCLLFCSPQRAVGRLFRASGDAASARRGRTTFSSFSRSFIHLFQGKSPCGVQLLQQRPIRDALAYDNPCSPSCTLIRASGFVNLYLIEGIRSEGWRRDGALVW
jgi:hypothetical protein